MLDPMVMIAMLGLAAWLAGRVDWGGDDSLDP
jgi:hypothetical protein